MTIRKGIILKIFLLKSSLCGSVSFHAIFFTKKVVRTTLISGLLRTVAESKHMPLPLKIFEVSDVVLNDKTTGNIKKCA